jgi:hypothetical protein
MDLKNWGLVVCVDSSQRCSANFFYIASIFSGFLLARWSRFWCLRNITLFVSWDKNRAYDYRVIQIAFELVVSGGWRRGVQRRYLTSSKKCNFTTYTEESRWLAHSTWISVLIYLYVYHHTYSRFGTCCKCIIKCLCILPKTKGANLVI